MLQVWGGDGDRGGGGVLIQWETNCPMGQDQRVSWRVGEDKEVVLGQDEIRRFRMGRRKYLYRVQLVNLPTDRYISYTVHLSRHHQPFEASFPVIQDMTGQVAPPNPPALSTVEVGIIGDNQDGPEIFRRICRNLDSQPRPHLLVHLGDRVQKAGEPYRWQKEFFDPLERLASHVPMIAANGNHDINPADDDVEAYIKSPYENGTTYFAVSIGPARWIVLDTNQETDAQVAWLEKELGRPSTQKATFKIVLCHIPPFMEFWDPVAWHQKGESAWPVYVRSRMVPLFEKHRVDLVMSGHQHNYQRGLRNGVNYIISGGAGGDLDADRVTDHAVYRTTIIAHHYLRMTMSRAGLAIRAYSVSGSNLIDSFYIPRSMARKMKPSEMLPQ